MLGNLVEKGEVELETDRKLQQQLVDTVQPLKIKNNDINSNASVRYKSEAGKNTIYNQYTKIRGENQNAKVIRVVF